MKKATILIVEDEMIVARHLASSLERCGYEIAGTVTSGEEAVTKAEATRPDLVLMDIRLEGELDGIEAAATIQSRFNIPIVYITAHSDSVSVARVMATRPAGYLTKPFSQQDLRKAIEDALEGRQGMCPQAE